MAKVRKVTFDVDLEDLFGAPVRDEALRQAIGGAIIERIVERTQDGISKTGSTFKGYSKAYKDSLEFKAFGKSGAVDLTLTGDMLAGLTIVKESPTKLTLGFTDPELNTRAFAHVTGFEGHPFIKNGPKRDFMGLPAGELKGIADQFSEVAAESNELKQADRSNVTERARATLLRILELVDDDG